MVKMHAGELEKRFGRVVRRLREEKHFTQEAFADHIGIDRSYQGKIERGEVSVTLHKIGLISQGLGVTPGQLLIQVDQAE